MRAPLVVAGSIAALLTLTGCASRSLEELGVAGQAEGDAPKIGAPVDVAPPSLQPVSVLDAVFTARGDGYLAVFLSGPFGREMFATPFDAQGAPETPGSIDLGPCDAVNPAMPAMAAACAPSGDCVVGCSSIIQGPLTIATLAADGTVGSVATTIDDYDGLAIAFDGQAFVFAAASNETTVAFHFEGGAIVEPTPIEVTPNGAEVGIACAPDRRCLIVAGETAVLQDTDGTLGAPFSETLALGLTYGAGVYLGYTGFDDQYGLVRIGMDGVPLDPAPLPLTTAMTNPIGAGFDGQFYNLLFDTGSGSMSLARRASDGSDASPAIVELGALPVDPNGTIACIPGSCACAARAPATGALTAVVIADDTPSLAADALANLLAGQTFVKVIPVDAGAVVVWWESSALRARLFSTQGAPLGDAVTITESAFLNTVDSDGHSGLIFWNDLLGHDVTTVVHADGSIGSNLPLTPPATSSAEPARFLGIVGNRTDGKVRAYRLDADGRPLDPSPIVVGHIIGFPGGAMAAFARDDGLFAIAMAPEQIGPVALVRLRPTGEIVGPSEQVLKAAPPTGLACSPDTCVVTAGLETTSAISFVTGDGPLKTRPFDPLLGSHDFTVAFDGNTFVATYGELDEIHVVRIDGDAWATGRAPLHGERVAGAAAVAPKELFVLTSPNDAEGALRLRVVHDGELPTDASSSGEGGDGSAPTPPRMSVSNGCGCSTPGGADSSPAAATLLGALLLAAGVRSRRAR
jgi:MYXO-CTERM domain-containing protein